MLMKNHFDTVNVDTMNEGPDPSLYTLSYEMTVLSGADNKFILLFLKILRL